MGFHSPPWYPVTTRAGTPPARISSANAEAKWPQNPRRVLNRKSSTESRSSSGGVRVYSKWPSRNSASTLFT